MKGVPFVNKRYTKGIPFCSEMVEKGKGLDLWAEPPHAKSLLSNPLVGGRGGGGYV